MSKVNITRNTFLEAEELSIFQQMLEDSVAKAVTLSNTTTWGIIRDYTEVEDTSFKVGTGTNVGTVKIGKALSRAVGSDGLLCTQLAIDNIVIPQDSLWYWVRVSHKYRRHEKGDVSVSLDGTLSGAGTEFTKVLRGVQSDVPTKVRFIKTDGSQLLNSGIYEVVEVSGDLVASLNSPLTFLEETNLKMIVVGATPINETITPSQLEGLYYYDDCNIEIVPEVVSDTQPVTGFIQNRTFYIARVQNNAGIVTIQAKRIQYWQPNVPGVTDRLSKFENLNDLNNKATARANLDVYSKGEGDARYLLSGDSSAFLLKASNLADVPDKTAARSNLDIYSKGQVDTLFSQDSGWIDLTINTYFAVGSTARAKQWGNIVSICFDFRVTVAQSLDPYLLPESIGLPVGNGMDFPVQTFIYSTDNGTGGVKSLFRVIINPTSRQIIFQPQITVNDTIKGSIIYLI